MRAKTSKFLPVVIAGLLLIWCTSASAWPAKDTHEEKFAKSVPLVKDGTVVVRSVSGDITIKTWDRAEVNIDALKVSKASSMDKAKENADKVKIEVTEEGKTLRIEVDYPNRGFRNASVSVHFNLMIPDKASADAKSVSGDIRVSNIGGEARVEAVSGDLSLENIAGSLKAHSVSGDVEVTKVSKGADCSTVSGDVEVRDVLGDVFLNSVSGEISAEQVKGGVDAETVSGDITLKGVSKGRQVKAKALSGTVRYEGEIYPDGRYQFTSHSGRITLTIPAEAAFDLEARTFSGTINSDFEIKIAGTISKKKLSGSINGGGAEVVCKTFSGDIYLEKR